MNIPNVKTLIEKVSKKINEDKKKDEKKLQNLLSKRVKYREKWSEKKRKEYESYLVNLKNSHNNYINAVIKEIVLKTELVLKNNPSCRLFQIINPEFIDCDLLGFKTQDIYRGFWDAKNQKYDRIKHYESGIKNYPINEIIKKMKSYGYLIEEIEDNIDIILEISLDEKVEN